MISVYIADDEVWITIGLKKLIQKSGLPFEVIGEAHNGVTTLENLKTECPVYRYPYAGAFRSGSHVLYFRTSICNQSRADLRLCRI